MILGGKLIVLLTAGFAGYSCGQGSGPPPPEIPFHNLSRIGSFFNSSDVAMYTSFLFDYINFQIILGARDHLVRLNMNLVLVENHEISAPSDRVASCTAAHPEEDCHNIIPVLHMVETRRRETLVYACGTYAFDPRCFVRDLRNLANPEKMRDFSGLNRVPKSTRYQGVVSSWLNPLENLLFVGTSLGDDVQTSTIAVSEMSGNQENGSAKTLNGSLALRSAVFAGTFQSEDFVYFVFSEPAIESSEEITSRIGRLCTDGDVGNPDFTSFTKTTLRCGDFNTVSGIYFLKNDYKLFATFTKRAAGVTSSAICVYNLFDILNAFSGDYLCERDGQWAVCPPRPLGASNVRTCFGDRNVDDVRDRILRNTTVSPVCGGPSFMTTRGSVFFRHLTVLNSLSGFYGHKVYVGDNRSGKVWNINLGYCNDSSTGVQEIWEVTRLEDQARSPEIKAVSIVFDSEVCVLTCCGFLKFPGLNFVPTTERIPVHPGTSDSSEPPDISTYSPIPQVLVRTSSRPEAEAGGSGTKLQMSFLFTTTLAAIDLRLLLK